MDGLYPWTADFTILNNRIGQTQHPKLDRWILQPVPSNIAPLQAFAATRVLCGMRQENRACAAYSQPVFHKEEKETKLGYKLFAYLPHTQIKTLTSTQNNKSKGICFDYEVSWKYVIAKLKEK